MFHRFIIASDVINVNEAFTFSFPLMVCLTQGVRDIKTGAVVYQFGTCTFDTLFCPELYRTATHATFIIAFPTFLQLLSYLATLWIFSATTERFILILLRDSYFNASAGQ